jgi:hypothetical protein
MPDPRILPYKPEYKVTASFTMGYLEKINSENLEHAREIITFHIASTKAFTGTLTEKE